MKKKLYVKPKLTTIPINYSSQLLAGSGSGSDSQQQVDFNLNNAAEGSETYETEINAKLWKDTNLWED